MKTLSELQIIAEGKYPKYKTITDYRHNDGSLMSAKDWGFYCHIMTNEQLSEWTPLYDGCNVQKAYIQGCLDTQEVSGWFVIDGTTPRPWVGVEINIKLRNGSIINDVLPQSDGDYWTRSITGGDLFISEHMVTHWQHIPNPPKEK